MPFLKVSRDKRGYEHYYLMESLAGRRGRVRQRILYWFRSPPNVKIGRQPFDEWVARELQAQYPGVVFDWDKLRQAPAPVPPAEYWRERRRSERATRQFQEGDESEGELPAGRSRETAEVEAPRDTEPLLLAAEERVPDTADSAGFAPQRVVAPGSARRRRRRRGNRGRGSDRPAFHGGQTADPVETSPRASADSVEAAEGHADDE